MKSTNPKYSEQNQIWLGFLRDARNLAQQDSEDFDVLIQSFERIGAMKAGRFGNGLADYRDSLLGIARDSPLACVIPNDHPEFHIHACRLFELIRIQRNDAFHQGIVARNLVRHAIEFSTILEHSLMKNVNFASELMVRSVCFADLYHPVSHIRQSMLVNAYSYLPVRIREDKFAILSDVSLAKWLSEKDWKERSTALASSLKSAIESSTKLLTDTTPVPCDSKIFEIVRDIGHQPMLLHAPNRPNEIVGLISGFDLL